MSEEKLEETRENLTKLRAYSANYYWKSDLYTDFEKTYGKYLYVPFDVPVIRPNNMMKFAEFYFRNAQPITKVKTDILSSKFEGNERSPYLSITSKAEENSDVWSPNTVPEIYNEFPEIFEQIHEYLPFVEDPLFKWSMWSSNRDVPAHRDYGSQIDAPVGVRIKLLDTNPNETLSLLPDPLERDHNFDWYPLNIPKDTNTFAWNNLRQKHRSIYNHGHRKVLMIFSAKSLHQMITGKCLNRYIDILDRSIAKYQKETVVDTATTFSDYLTFTEADEINKIL
jgi:hypothetical protein